MYVVSPFLYIRIRGLEVQITIYFREEDEYLIKKVEEKAKRDRKSKSATILSIIEEYFEAEKRVGEILRDFGVISQEELQKSLSIQNREDMKKRIGEILLEKGFVMDIDLDRALDIQKSERPDL